MRIGAIVISTFTATAVVSFGISFKLGLPLPFSSDSSRDSANQMSTAFFWSQIDDARSSANEHDAQIQWFRDRTQQLSSGELAGVLKGYEAVLQVLYRWELVAAWYLIHPDGGVSFEHFLESIMLRGEIAYNEIAADPDSLALLPDARNVCGCEDSLFARKSDARRWQTPPAGEQWLPWQLEQVMPRLWKRFHPIRELISCQMEQDVEQDLKAATERLVRERRATLPVGNFLKAPQQLEKSLTLDDPVLFFDVDFMVARRDPPSVSGGWTTILDLIRHKLSNGQAIDLPQFGRFVVIVLSGVSVRNPVTGEMGTLPPQRLVRFYPSRELYERLNESQPKHSSGIGQPAQ